MADGDISMALDWFVRAGIEGILPLERQAGVDLERLRQRHPRTLFIGHFDKIGLNASLYSTGIDEQPWYDRLVINLLEAILDHGYIIEINTKAWQQHNRFFPNQKYFPLLKKYNAPIIVNSDAHYPALIDSGRPEALQLLKLC